jgi:hypothetical protein
MFLRIKRSWYMFRGSLRLLNKDRELLIFPLISGVLLMLIISTFVLPLVWASDWVGPDVSSSIGSTGSYVLMFIFYLISYSLSYFFNAAIIASAIYRMKGGDPNIRGGLKAAWARIGSILGWAAIAATVGLLLKGAQDRAGFVGKIVIGFIGVAWSVVSYLVVPVIVMENKSPYDALMESASMVKKTWGEKVAGNIGIGFFMFLILLPLFVVVVPAIALVQSELLTMIMITAIVLYTVFAMVLQTTLTAIFDAALYLYAREDFVAPEFGLGVLEHAFDEEK